MLHCRESNYFKFKLRLILRLVDNIYLYYNFFIIWAIDFVKIYKKNIFWIYFKNNHNVSKPKKSLGFYKNVYLLLILRCTIYIRQCV